MSRHLSARLLQVAVALGGCVPVLAGLAGVLRGAGMADADAPLASPALDSHMRYLSGLLLAIGLCFWSLVPRIVTESAGRTFRLLTFLVVIGGLGRLLGIVLHGVPPTSMALGLAMELAVTPLLCWWQADVSRRHRIVAL